MLHLTLCNRTIQLNFLVFIAKEKQVHFISDTVDQYSLTWPPTLAHIVYTSILPSKKKRNNKASKI